MQVNLINYKICAYLLLDIHYVDVSTLVQKSISSLKACFNYWFDKCSWHRPSVLILDNLDKLLSAEVEVCVIIVIPRLSNVSVISTQTRFVHAILLNCFSEYFPLLRGLLLSTHEGFF